ncbi:MAG: CSLREA domain-containing protein [Chloroflexi bacterium]|nr:CSLREA domain-containing protein [Chloroflexota bacterium]
MTPTRKQYSKGTDKPPSLLVHHQCGYKFLVALVAVLMVSCTATGEPTISAEPTQRAAPAVEPLPTATPTPVPEPTATALASIIVTTTDDEYNTDGDCSLREAIIAANSDAPVDACLAGHGDDTITLPSGTYALGLMGVDEDQAASGDLDVTTNLTLQGTGTEQTTVDGAGIDRVFHVLPEGVLTLKGITVSGGNTVGEAGEQVQEQGGGGIFNQGALYLADCVLTGNAAQRGGGLYNLGAATMAGCTISNHNASNGGGGINNRGTLIINDSTITANTTPRHGGGIHTRGALTITYSSITGNVADKSGGGIRTRNEATVSLTGVTLADNRAGENGGGISNAGLLTIAQSGIRGNSAAGSGGGIENEAQVELTDVTITGNTADADGDGEGNGGGFYNGTLGAIQVQSSALDGNYDLSGVGEVHPDCSNDGGSVIDLGGFQIENPVGCDFAGN